MIQGYSAIVDRRAIGRAYVEQFEPKRIAAGRDMRVSSPAMHAAFVEGAAAAGAEVLDVGMIGTEMLYYAVGELGLDGGATVTASHNPKEYTGMKIVRRGALPVGGDSGLASIRARAEEGFGPVVSRGDVRPEDVWPGFVEKVLSFVDPSAIDTIASSGTSGRTISRYRQTPEVSAPSRAPQRDSKWARHHAEVFAESAARS